MTSPIVPADTVKAVEKEGKKELAKEVGVARHDQMMLQLLPSAGPITIHHKIYELWPQ